MKKTLLSLLCAAVGVFTAAADVTDVLTVESLGYNGTNNADLTKASQAQYESFADKTVTSPAVWAGNAAQQITGSKAAGYDITGNMQFRWDSKDNNKRAGLITTTSGGTAKSVKVTWGTASITTGTKAKFVVYGSNTPYTTLLDAITNPGDELLTFDPNVDASKDIDGSYKYLFIHGLNAACYIASIEVTWADADAPVTTVAKPQITPNGGEISAETKISLSCSTDAAEIWYAYAPTGTDVATVEKVKYTEPFTIPASGAVEAIAKKEGLTDSDPVTATFTIPNKILVDNIAALIALDNTSDLITVTGEVAVTYQNGKNIYMSDASGSLCVYTGTATLNLKNGDRLTGITGKYTKYSTGTQGTAFLPEMLNIDVATFNAIEGAAVEPEVLTVEDIAADMAASYVKIENATITKDDTKTGSNADKYFIIEDETGSFTLYNGFGLTVGDGAVTSATGILTVFQGALQFSATDIVYETPLVPEKGDKEDPYTVAEAIAKYNENADAKTTAWVEGYIVGAIPGQDPTKAEFSYEVTSKTNIVLAPSEDCVTASECLPVQLTTSGQNIRAALNLVDNVGKYKALVKINGSIEKYFGTAGLKSPTEWVVVRTTGIESVDNAAKAVAISGMIGAVSVTGFEGTVEIYNILGQLVSATPVSGNATIPARAGIALVKAGNVVAKIIVK